MGRQGEPVAGDRHQHHRQRAEQRHRRHGIGDVGLLGAGDGVGGDDGGGAADRGAGGDEFGELRPHAEAPAEPDGEGEGRDQDRRHDDEAARADLEEARRRHLEAEHDDRQAQQAAHGEGDPAGEGMGQADGVADRHAETDRQDHRRHRRKARQTAQQHREAGDADGEGEAGQNVADAAKPLVERRDGSGNGHERPRGRSRDGDPIHEKFHFIVPIDKFDPFVRQNRTNGSTFRA